MLDYHRSSDGVLHSYLVPGISQSKNTRTRTRQTLLVVEEMLDPYALELETIVSDQDLINSNAK